MLKSGIRREVVPGRYP